MADAAVRGARVETELRVLRLPAVSARADDVLGADGFIFATPENLGSMSGLMKDFFDRTYYGVIDRVEGRPYAIMVLCRQRRPEYRAAGRTHRHGVAIARRHRPGGGLHQRPDTRCDHGPEENRSRGSGALRAGRRDARHRTCRRRVLGDLSAGEGARAAPQERAQPSTLMACRTAPVGFVRNEAHDFQV